MKRSISLLMVLVTVMATLLSACVNTPATTQVPTKTPQKTEAPTTTDTTPTNDPTPNVTPEEPYVFPEDGALKSLEDGKAPYAPDGKNPSLVGDTKLLVFFEFAYKKAGLDLADDTVITYKVTKNGEAAVEGTATLDTSVSEIKNEYGYIGVCFDCGKSFGKYEKGTFEISFKDKSGKEYTLKNQNIYKGVSYLGLDSSAFDAKLGDKVTTSVAKQSIIQSATIDGVDFTFTLYLSKWAGKTSVNQIITVSQLFWEVYPRMYSRFGEAGQSPTDVSVTIEDTGYEIASASGNDVHIHDQWLRDHQNDYDCLTHEFAHVIQNGWDGKYCEYSDYIERFADCCRYLYAYQNGKFNDSDWTLNTVSGESTREKSVRFLVWMDYFYSTEDNDLLLKFFTACRSKKYPASNWNAAWEYIFEGSELEGKTADQVWDMYAASEFANLSAKGVYGIVGFSPLLKKYDVRENLVKKHG